MRAKMVLTLTALLAAGVVAVGCGDDDSDDGESTSITKEEWIAQAGGICTEGDAAMNAEAEEFFSNADGPPDKEAELEFQTEVVLPGLEEQVSGVAALPRPEGDEEEIEAIIEAAEAGLEEARADPAALEDEADGPLNEATRLIADYGVTDCA